MNSQSSAPTPDDLLAQADFLRGLCRGLLADSASAEDVAQDIHLEALQRPPQGVRSWSSWLRAAVRSRGANVRRAEARRAHHERAGARAEATDEHALILERLEVQSQVAAAVVALDEPYRQVIYMRYTRELGPAEIAAELSLPIATVKTRLRRALEKLRSQLDAHSKGDRNAWCMALAPLAGLRSPAQAGAVAASGPALWTVLVGIKLMTTAAAVLAAAGLWALWPDSHSVDGLHGQAPLQASDQKKLMRQPDTLAANRAPAGERLSAALDSELELTPKPQADEVPQPVDWLISGLISDPAGAPVPGAKVELTMEHWDHVFGVSTSYTDETGHYQTPLSFPQALMSRPLAPSFIIRSRATAASFRSTRGGLNLPNLSEQGPQHLQLDMTLIPGVCVRGRVVDIGGMPVAGASVALSDAGGRSHSAAISDALGEYAFLLKPELEGQELHVAAHSSQHGFGLLQVRSATASDEPESEDRADLLAEDLILKSSAELRGRLLYPDGTPLAHIELQATLIDGEPSGGFNKSWMGGSCKSVAELGSHSGLADAWTTTDSEGFFLLAGLQAGIFHLALIETLQPAGEEIPVGDYPAGSYVERELDVHRLSVRVNDRNGMSVFGAPLTISVPRAVYNCATSGSLGEYALFARPGDWTLTTRKQGSQGETRTVQVSEHNYYTVVELLLDHEPPMGRIALDLRDSEGVPINGMQFGYKEISNTQLSMTVLPMEVDEEGLPPQFPIGEYTYSIWRPEPQGFYLPVGGIIEVRAGETTELTAISGQGGRVKLRIQLSSGSKERFWVSGAPLGKEKHMQHWNLYKDKDTQDSEQVLLSQILKPGPYHLRIGARGHETIEADVQVLAGQSIDVERELRRE